MVIEPPLAIGHPCMWPVIISTNPIADVVAFDKGFQLVQVPLPQWIEAITALEIFHWLHVGALAGLEALAPGDLGLERLQRPGQGNGLAKIAAGIGIAGP